MRKFLTLMLVILLALSVIAACGTTNLSDGEDMAGASAAFDENEVRNGADGLAMNMVIGPRGNNYDDPANGVYVSPNGNDSTATGSISAPFKSINAALAAVSPGGTVILRGGTYREGVNVRIRKPNITIKSAKGEWAVIDLTTYNSGHGEDSGVYFDVESSGGKLQGVEVMGGFYAVCLETKWDWGQADRSGASNIIIEDCILHDSRNDVVKVKPNCDNVTIRFNEIYNSGRAYAGYSDFDTGERNSEGIDNVNGDNMIVQNNYIHDICSNAIYAKGGATDALIENNYIERAYGAGIMLGFDTSPEFFDLSVNPQYYENIRGVVRNNLVTNVGWEGIGLYASRDTQVYNNTIVNAVGYGRGLYHSPIYFGVATQDWGNPGGCPPNINPNIHHNVVVQPASYNNRMIDIRYATGVYSHALSGLSGNPVMSDNCYYVVGKNATFSDNRQGGTLSNARLSAWQAHINGDNGSLEVDPALDADFVTTNPECAGMGWKSLAFAPPEEPEPPEQPTDEAPVIAGGQASLSLTEGYVAISTAVFTVTGLPAPVVTQDNTHGDRIIWNNDTQRLDITAGLAAGSYPVVIAAENTAGRATFTFTLTVDPLDDGGSTEPEPPDPPEPPEPPTPPTPPDPPTPPTPPTPPAGGTYNISDYYTANGKYSDLAQALPLDKGEKVLTAKQGDIIIVGSRQYVVTGGSLRLAFYTQPSMDKVIAWWTDYMDSWQASGKVTAG